MGLLNPIKEEDCSPTFIKKFGSSENFEIEERSDNTQNFSSKISEITINFQKNLDNLLKVINILKLKNLMFNKETKNGNFIEIKLILNQYDQEIIKKPLLLNDWGSGGWNVLHFAVFCGHIEIVKYFIEKYKYYLFNFIFLVEVMLINQLMMAGHLWHYQLIEINLKVKIFFLFNFLLVFYF